jgi:hypothetical protein
MNLGEFIIEFHPDVEVDYNNAYFGMNNNRKA